MTWVVWLTGLPGAGKSTIAREFMALLDEDCELLRLDEFRKKLAPEPKYTEEERDIIYNALGVMAALLEKHGVNVLVDATAHRKKWRERARSSVRNFYEVYVRCPVDVCMQRESERKDNLVVSEMYRKAIERKRRMERGEEVEKSELGQVIGVDVPYEAPEHPALVIDTENVAPGEGAKMIYKVLYG